MFLLALKAFHNMLRIILNPNFILKCSPYAIRFTNNFIRIMCKSNNRYFNVVTVAINLWNTLPNSIKTVKSYVSFKMHIKCILLKLYT